jgi:hypothetical protein
MSFPPGPISGNGTTSAISASTDTDSSAPTSANTPQSGSVLTGGASPPLIVGFISVGAFAIAIICICAWSRFVGRRSVLPDSIVRWYYRFMPASFRRGGRSERGEEGEGEEEQLRWGRGRRRRRRGRGGERAGTSVDLGGKTKPEMFDAWISRRRRSVDIFKKWEAESVVSCKNPIYLSYHVLLMRVMLL